MYLSTLTDAELVRFAHTEANSLTSTPLELELLKRLETLSAASERGQPLTSVLEEFNIEESSDLEKRLQFYVDHESDGPLLDVLLEYDFDETTALRRALDRIAKFDAVMNDLAKPLSDLQQLTESP